MAARDESLENEIGLIELQQRLAGSSDGRNWREQPAR